ncbi:acetyl-CoA carboxylase biotin carboxylase subunit [candidate division KSB1 bacterium]
MFNKVLIANRGEIALRIIRACKEMGINTVAVYSEVDRHSLHVKYADEAVCIGPAPPTESYLNYPRIISSAEITNSDAIHPGYGFLAEDPQFAEICASCGIKFIGPKPDVIDKMGHKSLAKNIMEKVGVPIIPGSNGTLKNWKDAREIAEDIGYPIILKASGGGGGKGMRIINNNKELKNGFTMAKAEVEKIFTTSTIYLEKFFIRPRHIEVQIFGDDFGTVVSMGDRDCSIQRRHQKLIEEAPAPGLSYELCEQMYAAATKGAKEVGYTNAGTIEFLLDSNNNFYFMEMNTRIQVEHPVTEMVIGKDLVKEQIRVSAGEPLGYTQEDIKKSGHSLECRINAEDSERGFIPCPGQVTAYNVPGGNGIRVDTHIYSQYEIPPYYDSLIAKVISFGKDRDESIMRMKRALEEFIIEGIKTNIPFHKKVLNNKNFNEGILNTAFLEEEINNGNT